VQSAAAQKISEIADLLGYLTKDERREVNQILSVASPALWVPLPGPQSEAFCCEADILYYGGSAGGGKTDLLLGLSLTEHSESIIFRRQSTQLIGIQNRLLDDILKSRKQWNGQDDILRLPGHKVEFGSCNTAGDEIKYQGRPHSLKGFDEITHFLESQFRFLCGWMRTTTAGERQRVVCTGNPPTSQDGQWIVKFWGPWLDDTHPNPAKPGELRWYTTIEGKDQEQPNGQPFLHKGEWITPRSRTFIPSHVQDNPFLMATGYEATLQALPEPLRSQMLNGDFRAGTEDDPWQVIPVDWVEQAQARWNPEGKRGPMDSIGLDPSRGGRDTTDISRRHGMWFDKILQYPGQSVPDGPACAALAVTAMRDGAPIHVDVIGIGSSVYDHLKGNNIHVVAVNGAAASDEMDKSGKLRFRNQRAVCYWRMREALDPKNNTLIALPPDPELKADLCAPKWTLTAGGVLVEPKENVIKRIGRSPGKGDSAVYALMATAKKGLEPPVRSVSSIMSGMSIGGF
jgi:hypothetical protein